MDAKSSVGPERTPVSEAPVKKSWSPPRLTVHGTLPTLTYAASPKTEV